MPGAPGTVNVRTSKALDLTAISTSATRPLAPRHGKAESLGCQYPHSVVVGERRWVIYSIKKEDIEVVRIPLPELYSL